MVSLAGVIVTHNSANVIELCLQRLFSQARQLENFNLTIVDSGSQCTQYLEKLSARYPVDIIFQPNIGFSRANNLGVQRNPDADYILFINPDALIRPQALSKAIAVMQNNPSLGCVTGKLHGYDLLSGRPTGYLDSTGIWRKWYGRWFDRGQGVPDKGQFASSELVPAICGAFMFCRMSALKDVALPDGAVFDPAFFMYKEDIELSLRLRKKGWKLMYVPEIEVYHCRGWNRKRSDIPLALREMSAKNEVLLCLRYPSFYCIWAVAKYLFVKGFRL